jgi:hypothetical protein
LSLAAALHGRERARSHAHDTIHGPHRFAWSTTRSRQITCFIARFDIARAPILTRLPRRALGAVRVLATVIWSVFVSLDTDMTVAEIATPPTMREQAVFDAATTGTPKEFVRACRAAGLEPVQMLDTFDAAPWRWLFSFSPDEAVTDEVRHRTYQPGVRHSLDAAREYLETSWWRRLFMSPEPDAPAYDRVWRTR